MRFATKPTKDESAESSFAVNDDDNTIRNSSSKSDTNSINGRSEIYTMPALYDMAFGYRNYEEEVDFLIDQHMLINNGREPKRIIELAAGPARHSIETLKGHPYVDSVTAVDISSEMMKYGMEIAVEELQQSDNNGDDDGGISSRVDSFSYIRGDMSNFTLSSKVAPASDTFDSAWILLGSLQHLATNDQVVSCFNCIHRVLGPGGTLILELPHPREIFSMVECTRNGWEIPLDDENGETSGKLKIVWGDDDDTFDPVKQVRYLTVSMELTGNHNLKEIYGKSSATKHEGKRISKVSDVVPMRHFTSQEIDVLARIAGFKVTSMHGAIAHDVDVNDDDEAYRLICILQKKD